MEIITRFHGHPSALIPVRIALSTAPYLRRIFYSNSGLLDADGEGTARLGSVGNCLPLDNGETS
jgi:hypothetical protein